MNVSEVYIIAVLMPIATTLKGLTTVHVNLDSLEMDENAKVIVWLNKYISMDDIYIWTS